MTKVDYLSSLRMHLTGRVTAGEVEEHVSYYENYINSHIRMGEMEEDILNTLGDPSLIAKSIISASMAKGENGASGYGDVGEDYVGGTGLKRRFDLGNLPVWIRVGGGILILLLILSVILHIFVAALPVLIPIGVILFVIRYFRKNL